MSFDAFEVIRLITRQSQDRVPGLFAAFISAADAAVDGREAVTIAPSLPQQTPVPLRSADPAAGAGTGELIQTLVGLGTMLDERLTRAASMAANPGDRAACEEAAEAARRIRQLMAAGADDSGLW